MGLNLTLGSLVFFFWMSAIWARLAQEGCTDFKLQFERVFSVPGDVAMLNSTLLSPDVLNYTAVPYNITWYNSKTGQEMSNQPGQILVLGETLWFLNTTLEDAGEYMTILRTHCCCYMQSTMLVVDMANSGECGRPQKTCQELTGGVADHLNCPLRDYIHKLEIYGITSSIQWYKGCEPLLDGSDKYTYWDRTLLNINNVEPEDSGTYTCTLTFTLGGVTGSVSESIDAPIRDEYSLVPQVHEPTNEIIKAKIGSNLTMRCLVFVPGVGIPFVDVLWLVRNDFIFGTSPPANVYTSEQRMWIQNKPQGVWFERMLFISELKEEDFYINYTCQASSFRGVPKGYFTLLPTDPDILLPIGLVFCHVVVLFIVSVTVYYIFRIDIVLWFRKVFPFLYKNKDLDGKLYDAYVAYPQSGPSEFGEEMERFALHTLPQMLEQAYGYKLFIAGRDCLPGQAMVDSVNENIQASRCILLLYTASTFIGKKHTSSTSSNNNNVPISRANKSETVTSDSSVTSFYDDEKVFLDTRQPLESVAAMHQALLEGSLKVILVELEEITPDQLALFPESVRHLRKKQGAVCWWKYVQKRQTWRTCVRERGDEEKHGQDSRLSLSHCPSSRFWKEIRFHMPVRGKRVGYLEETVLLNL
uniref:Interleukin 1 receptor, type I n=2 Tax=Iconisemion striatum TaxID=60296 RepID=A0A1A7WP77_9TELE